MRPAAEYVDLTGPGAWTAYRWEVHDAASRVDLSASAVSIGGQLFFVDPIPLARPALDELTADATPAGIVVTNANHARAAADFRRRFNVPLCLTENARVETGVEPDLVIPNEDGPILDGAFEAIAMPGGAGGEVALFRPDEGGLLIVGDALINLSSYPFGLLPAKYCSDSKLLRRSVTRLLDRSFSRMLFAHGEPLVTKARERLAQMLDAH